MTFRTLTHLLAFSLALLFPLTGAVAEPAGLEKGRHYAMIDPPAPPADGKPQVVEVFNFMCGHCFKLHPLVTPWAHAMKGKVAVSAIPIFWGKQTDAPARAYWAAKIMGKGEEMKDALFKAHFVYNQKIEKADVLAALAKKVGLDPDKHRTNMRSFAVAAKLGRSKVLQEETWQVFSTPTLVINGTYRVSPSHTGGDMKEMFRVAEQLIGVK